MSQVSRPIVALAAFAVAVSVALSAQAEPIGGPQQLTAFDPTTDFSGCGGPAIAYNPATGKTLVAVAAPNPEDLLGDTGLLEVGLVGPDGALAAPMVELPQNVPARSPGQCGPPSLAPGGDGTWLVTWETPPDDGSVGGQVIGSDGRPVGSNLTISSKTNYSDIETTAAAWSEEESRYLVSWKADVGVPFPSAVGDQQIVGRFVAASGAGIGDDFLVTDIAAQIDNSQALAYGGGIWVAVGATSGSPLVAVGRVVDSTGPQGAVFEISPGAGSSASGPSIAFNPETAQFLVAYRYGPTETARLLDQAGAPVGAQFGLGSPGNRPRVAAAGAEGYLVTWHDGDPAKVYGLEVGPTGSVIGTPEPLSGPSPARSFRPSVTYSTCRGRYLVAWAGNPDPSGGGKTNYYARPWYLTEPQPDYCPGPPPPPDRPNLAVSIKTPGKVRAGSAFGAVVKVRNRGNTARDGTSRSGRAESLVTCLTLRGPLVLVRAKEARVAGREACWRRSSLGKGTSVSYRARVRARSSVTPTVARLRAEVTASGGSASGNEKIRIIPTSVPEPQPVTG